MDGLVGGSATDRTAWGKQLERPMTFPVVASCEELSYATDI